MLTLRPLEHFTACLTFRCLIALLALSGLTGSLAAQQSQPGRYARMVTIAPRPGQQSAFEAGYQRHLAWHRAQKDSWTWYGWTVVFGERLGLFMDGTFGHAATDFDQAIRPAADAADNAANVAPHADFLSHLLLERLDDVSRGASLPDTTPFLALTTYRISPGRAPAFEALLTRYVSGLERSQPDARFSWYRLRIGGQTPQYLLMRALPTLAAAARLPEFFEAAEVDTAGVTPLPDGIVHGTTAELLRYRPTLSYLP